MTAMGDDGSRVWIVEAAHGDSILSFEIYEAFGGPTAPGDVEMTEAETSYETCGTCLVLQTGCVAHNDHFDCERTFMPRAEGQLRIDAISPNAGEQFSGEALGLVFQEVVIGDNFQTDVVSGGALIALDPWSFDITLVAFSDAAEDCGGHGQPHGDHCDCDPGYRVDPDNPLMCIPV